MGKTPQEITTALRAAKVHEPTGKYATDMLDAARLIDTLQHRNKSLAEALKKLRLVAVTREHAEIADTALAANGDAS